jgi:hypothetical protein
MGFPFLVPAAGVVVLQSLVAVADAFVAVVAEGLESVIGLLLWLAVKLERLRRRLPRLRQRLRRSLRRLLETWRADAGLRPAEGFHCFRGWNRTPAHLEEGVVRLHIQQPLLGAG